MDNLIFSLNASLPVFFTMLLGLFFRRVGLFDEDMTQKMNRFVFKAALPVLLFRDLSTTDIAQSWDTSFGLFCFGATFLSICIAALLSLFLKDRSSRGEFIQAGYRSSAAILGIAFIQNIYGDSGMAPLMIISAVPLYNIMAVFVLAFFQPNREPMSRKLFLKTGRDILTNPILLGIAAGLLWALLRIPQPVIMQKLVGNLAALATPLGLMSMGASFEFRKAFGNMRPVLLVSFCKLIILAAVFLPAAAALGFRDSYLVAILIMLASPTTVSCYIMARNMGHEGTLSSAAVMLTTIFSAFTLTAWLYLLRSLGLV